MAEDPLSSLEVKYSHLTEIADQVVLRRKQLKAQMDALWDEVKKLEDVWQGEARQMFNAVDKQWHARATEILSQLDQIEKKIRNGSDHYRSTDVKASQLFQELGNM